MAEFTVGVRETWARTITVQADSAQAALDLVKSGKAEDDGYMWDQPDFLFEDKDTYEVSDEDGIVVIPRLTYTRK